VVPFGGSNLGQNLEIADDLGASSVLTESTGNASGLLRRTRPGACASATPPPASAKYPKTLPVDHTT
jgi:hypothetical protein